ncbi:MAG: TRAFAC clade GTPase domain-containing protein [Polyangiaceae bacterium]
MRARETRIVAVIGPRDAGKTSLIAGIFGLFLDGPVGGWAFAGGGTLRAFEIACHDARAVSKRQAPHFERTPRGPAGLYQLTLSAGPGAPLVDLLVADRAGEEYLEVTDDAAASKDLPELPRADVITLLVDGTRLLDVGARHNLQGDLALMIQAIHDGDALAGGQRLAIALTKHDEFDSSPQKERAEHDFDEFVAKTRSLFSASFSVIESFRLVASPDTDATRRGSGVAGLLAFWMLPTAPAVVRMPARLAPARAFGRLPPSVG